MKYLDNVLKHNFWIFVKWIVICKNRWKDKYMIRKIKMYEQLIVIDITPVPVIQKRQWLKIGWF